MSDQDQDVRELARGIAQWATPEELVGDESAERDWIEGAIRQWEAPILVMLDKREAELRDLVASLQMDVSTNQGSRRLESERDRALGEAGLVRNAAHGLYRHVERLQSGGSYLSGAQFLETQRLLAVELHASPLSKLAGEVIAAACAHEDAAERWHALLVSGDTADPRRSPEYEGIGRAKDNLSAAVGALRAALAREGSEG